MRRISNLWMTEFAAVDARGSSLHFTPLGRTSVQGYYMTEAEAFAARQHTVNKMPNTFKLPHTLELKPGLYKVGVEAGTGFLVYETSANLRRWSWYSPASRPRSATWPPTPSTR